jgi:hypothetical protein
VGSTVKEKLRTIRVVGVVVKGVSLIAVTVVKGQSPEEAIVTKLPTGEAPETVTAPRTIVSEAMPVFTLYKGAGGAQEGPVKFGGQNGLLSFP